MSARLTLVTDRTLAPKGDLAFVARAAMKGGVDCVQLRESSLSDAELLALAVELQAEAAGAGARLIVNHRVDVAAAADADGVHLGWRSMRVHEARRVLEMGRLVGMSCHSAVEARDAVAWGADYITLGPIFETPSKAGLLEPLGLNALRSICAAVDIPVIAIGGIDAERAGPVVQAGAYGVAVIRDIMAADDPQEAARVLRESVNAAL